jgi:hypothetical protein
MMPSMKMLVFTVLLEIASVSAWNIKAAEIKKLHEIALNLEAVRAIREFLAAGSGIDDTIFTTQPTKPQARLMALFKVRVR